jgi:nitrogenase molybdenum-iron protein NifN
LGAPLMRAGFPQYDWVGGFARAWVGYHGTRQALFDLANLMLSQHHDIDPYRSRYWAAERDGAPLALAEAGMVH